jgi:TonB family protein
VFAAAIFVYENNKSNEVAATDIQPAINDPNKLLSTPAVSPTGAKVLTAEIDDNRTFSGNEVDSRVQILERPDPTYTDTARQNRITGIVVLRAVFSSAGQVTNVHAVSGLPDGLTERAIVAAKNIRFVPATKEGHPVSMWMELQYKFNL